MIDILLCTLGFHALGSELRDGAGGVWRYCGRRHCDYTNYQGGGVR